MFSPQSVFSHFKVLKCIPMLSAAYSDILCFL